MLEDMFVGIFYVLQYMSLIVAIEMRKYMKEKIEVVVVLIATLFLIVDDKRCYQSLAADGFWFGRKSKKILRKVGT